MTEAQIIADLKSKGYNSAQAYAICKNRMKLKAQSGVAFEASLEGNPMLGNYIQPNMSYGNQNMLAPTYYDQNKTYFELGQPTSPQYDASVYTPGAPVGAVAKKEQDANTQQINKTNVINPFGGVSLENALNFAGRGFAEKDPWKAGIGTGLSLLKGGRNFLSGYATGKANRETYEDYIQKLYNPEIKPEAMQMGGIKNSEVLAMNALTDNPMGNTNAESGEFVKRTDGMVQPIVGEPHIKNGKKADGVDIHLNDGDKVLSDYLKLRPTDIKELKERYKISLKKGDTPAKALEKIETKIGLKKETEKLANSAEKLEKALKIKDPTSKQLSIETLQTVIANQNEKIGALKEVSAVAFDELFEMQEEQPKKGNGSQIYDKNGKEVTEENQPTAQQGGIFELASKYGISPERAKELVSAQQGMVQGQQEENQEGQASNPQEEQGEISQEQIMQAVMQMLQSGAKPEEIVQNLVQNGIPQELAVQAVQTMMQQSPQEEQIEGQMSNPQEEQMETAQQGGKVYAQQGIRVQNKYENPELFIKQGATTEDWKTFGEILKTNPKEATAEIKRLHPELYTKFFVNGELPKSKVQDFQNAVDEKYKNILEDAKVFYANEPEKLKQLENQINQDKFVDYSMENPSVRGRDNKFGNYTATRPNFAFPILPKEDLDKVNKAGVNTASELRDKFPDLYKKYVEPKGLKSDFWLANVNQPTAQNTETPTQQAQNEVTQPQELNVVNKTKSVMPMLPVDLRLPPSGVPPLLKSEISLGRLEPIKMTPEPMLAEQARQQYTAQEQVQATGLPVQIQQAILAQNLASGQMASNDAISKVEGFNRGQQYNADVFNIGQRAKEQLANEQYAQDYQAKMLGSIDNTQRDWRNYLIEGNLQNRSNYNSIENANLLNAMNQNYAYVPGVGIQYLDNQAGKLGSVGVSKNEFDNMTSQQLEEYKKKIAIAEKMKAYKTQQTM